MGSCFAYGQPAGNGNEEVERLLASSLLGRTDLIADWKPLAIDGANGWNAFTPTLSAARTHVQGSVEFSTGATPGSVSRMVGSNADSTTLWSKGIRALADWYLSSRFRAVTVPATGTILSLGLGDELGGILRLGVDVASHATNFCLAGAAGATINSGVPFDTAFHIFRAYRVGTSTWFQVDSAAPVIGTANIAVDSTPYVFATNGTAANQAMRAEWYFSAAPPL